MKNTLGMFSLKNRRILLGIFCVLAVYFLVFHNLTRFPAPWFDEGSHLHVPKTLVQYGVYADISSDGFRYYGPTIGVGPTVMLPIAGAFKLFGIGLLQARLVMALYLLAAIYVFYRLVEHVSGRAVALIALALLVSSRSILLLNYGRQLLGEVPGLFFIVLGLWLWFKGWGRDDWKRLSLIGLLFGLAMITKYQYLLFLAPTLILSWMLDIFYYKTSSHKNFIIPGMIAAFSFAVWQVITLQYLGPATAAENFALLRASAEGAAFNFDLKQIDANLVELLSRSSFLGALVPALIYGFVISIPRNRDGQKWSVLFLLTALNLGWFVISSIGWIRYAFLGLALSSIFMARLFHELAYGLKIELLSKSAETKFLSHTALTIWLAVIIMIPMFKTMVQIASPKPPTAEMMAHYLDENVPKTAIIETWDPEMGFLTDHNYHYPPNALLAVAVDQVYYGGDIVQDHYDFVQTEQPDYLLAGTFSKWTEIYPLDELAGQYELVVTFGEYDLFRRIE
jgi:4-amino-4-deoxy-L-arabinose transferase-like glycosyltransferase